MSEQKRKTRDGFVVAMGSPGSWNNKCVAVKITDNEVLIKDTKDDNSSVLRFNREEWQIFINGVKNNEFEL